MTMKRSLAAVQNALQELATAVRELAVSVDDCDIADQDLAVVEALRAHAAEVEGDVTETAGIVAAAAEAGESGDGARTARLVADAHERFCALSHRVRFRLSGHDSLFAVEQLPARRGVPWRRWSEVVLRQLEQIDHALHRADAAFVSCWQEVADRAAAVSVTTTSIAVNPAPAHRPASAT